MLLSNGAKEGAAETPADMCRTVHASDRRDTPPVDVQVVAAGLLARRSSHASRLPEAFNDLSDDVRKQLAADSCGGSAGIPRRNAVHRLPS